MTSVIYLLPSIYWGHHLFIVNHFEAFLATRPQHYYRLCWQPIEGDLQDIKISRSMWPLLITLFSLPPEYLTVTKASHKTATIPWEVLYWEPCQQIYEGEGSGWPTKLNLECEEEHEIVIGHLSNSNQKCQKLKAKSTKSHEKVRNLANIKWKHLVNHPGKVKAIGQHLLFISVINDTIFIVNH